MSGSIIAVNIDGEIVKCRHAETYIAIMPESYWIGKKLSDVLSSEDLKTLMEAVRAAINDRRATIRNPITVYGPDGVGHARVNTIVPNGRKLALIYGNKPE